jgi:two-component system response regulator (stage 0 sporulation protein F)
MQPNAMIVDDRKNFRRLLRYQLNSHGCDFKFYVARSGKEAIAKQKKLKNDLILMDMHMPNLDGPETIRKIREFDTDARIVVISAYPKEMYEPRTRDYNILGWFTKPIQEQIDRITAFLKEIENEIKIEKEIKSRERDVRDLEKMMEKNKELINDSNFRLNLLAAKTALALQKYPNVGRIIHDVFTAEVPELKAIVKNLEIIDIENLTEQYLLGLKKIRDIEMDLFGGKE